MSADRQPRLLIVEDERAIASLLRMFLARDADIVGIASTGAEALEMSRQLLPDVILLDMHLPDAHGVTVLRGLKQDRPEVRVLIYSGSFESYLEASELGAEGCLLKGAETRESLVRAVVGQP